METYNTDIEMVMDFMKLSIIFDNKKIGEMHRSEALRLQGAIIEMLPIVQSNRMEQAYGIIRKIYLANKREADSDSSDSDDFDEFDEVEAPLISKPSVPMKFAEAGKSRDNFIVLFHKSSCPACKKIMPTWNQFKGMHTDNPNFTILDWDSNDPKNRGVFDYFKIEFVPTVFKLELLEPDIVTKLEDPITLPALTNLVTLPPPSRASMF